MNDYIFDTGSELGRHHLDYLGNLLDAPSRWSLERRGLPPTARCLEIGAGSGAIATWLAARTAEVVAVDIDTGQLTDLPANVEVRRHDLREGLGVDGPFDLIHARLILMHLPEREQIFAQLVDALAPGGRLVIGDFTGRRLHPITTPTAEDEALWARVQYLSHELGGPARGISLSWAAGTAARMSAAGLGRRTHAGVLRDDGGRHRRLPPAPQPQPAGRSPPAVRRRRPGRTDAATAS